MKAVVLCLALAIGLLPVAGYSGGGQVGNMPPLDPTLMGFKEQGVWYYLCTAPIYGARIPPHYATYGPPPPPYCPPPCVAPTPVRPPK